MSLINYVEPASVGDMFYGIGNLVILLVIAYMIFKLFNPVIGWMRIMYNRESRYELIENKFLNDYAKEHGIDLDKEAMKNQILRKERKTFRRKIEDEMYEKFFGKEDIKDVKSKDK